MGDSQDGDPVLRHARTPYQEWEGRKASNEVTLNLPGNVREASHAKGQCVSGQGDVGRWDGVLGRAAGQPFVSGGTGALTNEHPGQEPPALVPRDGSPMRSPQTCKGMGVGVCCSVEGGAQEAGHSRLPTTGGRGWVTRMDGLRATPAVQRWQMRRAGPSLLEQQ